MRKIYNAIPLILLVIAGAYMQSCSKKYEDEKRAGNDITRFVIAGSTGDSVKCLIIDDTITINWDPEVAMPSTITPTIVVEEKATISPASGTAVPLNANTTYKVTAENGEIKTYTLKITLAAPIPSISSSLSAAIWFNNTQIPIYGEYFLAGTDTSKISAYLKRTSDGLEIPLEINKKQVTNYSIIANMPVFSAEMGIGLHQLFVKTGNRVAKGVDMTIYAPPINNVTVVSSFAQDGQDIHADDSLTINYTASSSAYNGRIADFYSTQEIATVVFYFGYEMTVNVTEFVRKTNSIKFKVPEAVNKYIGQSLGQFRIYYKTVHPDWIISSSYRTNVYFTTPSPVKAKG